MAVYRGVLHKMSGGSEAMATARTNSGGQLMGWDQRATGLTRRDFIEIGQQRLNNVVMSRRHDALLADSVGQEVQLSATIPFGLSRSYRVIGVRRPNGHVEKPGVFRMAFTLSFGTVQWWLLAAIVGVNIFLLSATGVKLAPLVLVLAVGIILFFLVWPVVLAVRMFRAWRAI